MPDNTPLTPESLGFGVGGWGFAPPPPDVNGHNGDDSEQLNGQAKAETKSESTVSPSSNEKPVDNKEAARENTANRNLADILREDREARATKNKEAQANTAAAAEAKQLRDELTKIKSSKAFEDDPIGYIKSRKITPEMQILIGQSLLYDLAPEKAPPDLRFKLFEAKTQRDNETREAAQKEAEARAQVAAVERNIEAFANALSAAARTFTEGSYPESESWFIAADGKVDHDNYMKSLMATANNIGLAAQKTGQAADLSPANIARTLEIEVARRMAVRDAKRAGATKKTEAPTTKADGNGNTTSTRGLNAGGAPTKPAMTEAERIARAAAVAFR